jgi:acyl-CoA synthetase (AMP-forming)/AMP-acid ligase II
MRATLQGSLYEAARRSRLRRALGFYSASGDLTWLTYDELLDLGRGAGGWLREQGLDRGETCVLAVGDARRTAALLLGVLTLGAVPLTMAPPGILRSSRGQAHALSTIARRARARIFVTDDPLNDSFEPLDGTVVRDVSHLTDAPQGPPVDPVVPSARAVASYQLTSGTTGVPRVCVWGQEALVARIETTRKALAVGPGDLFVSWAPLHHTMGLVNNFFLCLTMGIPLVLMSAHDFVRSPALWLRALHETRATQTWSANFGFALAAERIADEELRGVRLDSMRGFWNAAERIHVETLLSFHRRFRAFGLRRSALKTNYGCAENVGGATFGDPTGDFVVERVRSDLLYEHAVAERVGEASSEPAVSIVSVGRPCAGLRVEILRRGRRVPDGHIGEVAFVSKARMKGYLRDAASTRKVLRRRRLMTGDLGYLRGRELFWTGRVRERITVRGRKIDPSDFEVLLFSIRGLERGCFAAFGVEDATRGTEKAVIVAEIQDDTVDVGSIVRAVRAEAQRELGIALDDVLLVPRGSLTKTMSGKRRHGAYRERYCDGSLEALRVRP